MPSRHIFALLAVAMVLLVLYSDLCYAGGELSLEDIVVAMPTSTTRHPMVLSTRSWRSSMRTVITTNDTLMTEGFFRWGGEHRWTDLWCGGWADGPQFHFILRENPAKAPCKQETVLGYPDEVYTPRAWRHAPRAGEVRAALTPFLAHEHFVRSSQRFKWLLYGG